MTTVQDLPGRIGYWHVGVPPNGPMDDLAHRLVNRVVGNAEGAAALELTGAGPTLRFDRAGDRRARRGGDARSTVDGVAAPTRGRRSTVARRRDRRDRRRRRPGPAGHARPCAAGSPSRRTSAAARRSRSAASAATTGGRCAPATCSAIGDRRRRVRRRAARRRAGAACSTTTWELGVLVGPHAAPDFLTAGGLDDAAARRVGGALQLGPHRRAPDRARARGWARDDGGEAGLHPSNIHDTGYAIGAVDLTGDMPIILGPDGPSLGGFVCPAVVAAAERWKLGQLAPGDRVRLVPWTAAEAAAADDRRARWLARATATDRAASPGRRGTPAPGRGPSTDDGVLARRPADGDHPGVTYRRAGDRFLLVEYGPMTLDLELRLRVARCSSGGSPTHLRAGVVDVTRRRALAARAGRRRRLTVDGAGRAAAGRRGRARRRRARRAAVADRAPAAVVGRPGDARGDRALHARRARRRAVVPVEHRVHPPHQRPRHASTTCTASCSTRRTSCSGSATSTSARRSPRRSIPATGW